jgi:hypothetical protein
MMTRSTSQVTAASPSRTVASRPSRGDHKVPVALIRGRMQHSACVGRSAGRRISKNQI